MIEYYARCTLGKNRAFWCVWDEGLWKGGPPMAHGYEATGCRSVRPHLCAPTIPDQASPRAQTTARPAT
jgi:hypothetical protein